MEVRHDPERAFHVVYGGDSFSCKLDSISLFIEVWYIYLGVGTFAYAHQKKDHIGDSDCYDQRDLEYDPRLKVLHLSTALLIW